jgi:uncharacterized membrane protein YphA (DoxX/SURF4 family)
MRFLFLWALWLLFQNPSVHYLIAFGLLTRPAAFLLGITMLVASTKKLSEAGVDGSELPLLFLILSFVILLRGPGKYSLDCTLF